ncbi:MAG: DNA alkylation repair protein [Hormoscilla sp. GM7CHS1pb]|nr:DNA alkylation repair protein [Hormoscilla sp. GM7CHS1pb]
MNSLQIEKLKERKGARKLSEIPDEVLKALHQGKIESVNLMEWLAIDIQTLLGNVLVEIGCARYLDRIDREALKFKDGSAIEQLKGFSETIFNMLEECDNGDAVFEALANHTSDKIRCLSAGSIAYNKGLSLPKRLEVMRRFATDRNMSVKEYAWYFLRSYLIEDLPKSFELLIPWVKNEDPNIRRCAVEATRPRGVWCKHIPALKSNPELGLTILEFVRSDASKYVQRAVGNWLNDASKSRPNWVISTCVRWQQESPTQETKWIVKHGLRTINKQDSRFPKQRAIER